MIKLPNIYKPPQYPTWYSVITARGNYHSARDIHCLSIFQSIKEGLYMEIPPIY